MSVLQSNADFVELTLAAFLAKKYGPDGFGFTNEIVRNTYEFGDLIRGGDAKIELQGGESVEFHTLLRKGIVRGFVGPFDVREVRQSQHAVKGSNDWSVYEWNWNIEDIESHLQKGGLETILKLAQLRQEAGHSECAEELEETWWQAAGNAHLLAGERPPFPGVKYHVTRDGYHVDGSSTVSGISVATDTRWLNRYCGPYGSNLNKAFTHDTTDSITSASQLLRKIKKAMRFVKFASPNGAMYATDDKKAMLAKQKIYVDDIAYDAIEQIQEALAHGNDNLKSSETALAEPTFRGVPFIRIEDLGVGSGGLPSQVHTAVPDPGRGAFVATNHPNTGECYLVNLNHFKVVGLEGVFPLRKPSHFDFKQQVLIQLYRWMMTTVCRSRQRQCVIWGFGPLQAA